MLKCWKIPKKMDCRVRLRKGFVTKTLLAYLTSILHAAQDRVWYVHDPHAYSDIKTHNLLGSWLNILPYFHIHMNTLWQHRKCNHFADGSFKCISFNERAVLFGLKSYCTWFQWVQLINIPPPPLYIINSLGHIDASMVLWLENSIQLIANSQNVPFNWIVYQHRWSQCSNQWTMRTQNIQLWARIMSGRLRFVLLYQLLIIWWIGNIIVSNNGLHKLLLLSWWCQ